MKWEYVAQPARIVAPACARVSFCLYLLTFTGTDRRKKRVLWFFILTQVVVNLGTLIEVLVACDHFSMLWDLNAQGRCWSPMIQAYIGFFQGAWNSSTDLALTFLPWLMIRNLQLERSTKVALGIVMGLSVFAMVASIVKTIELKSLGNRRDFTYSTSRFVICFTLEQYIVIICASAPTTRPLFIHIIKKIRRWRRLQADQTSAEGSLPTATPSPYSQGNGGSWGEERRPQAIRLHSRRDPRSAKVELESPYIHPKAKRPPLLGTIRKTVSIYVRSESRVEDSLPDNSYFGVQTVASSGEGRRRGGSESSSLMPKSKTWPYPDDVEKQ